MCCAIMPEPFLKLYACAPAYTFPVSSVFRKISPTSANIFDKVFVNSFSVKFVKNFIDDGKLGEIISGVSDFFSTGKLSTRPWKYNKLVAGGGASFDLGVHMVDTIRFICQKKRIAYNHPLYHYRPFQPLWGDFTELS